MYHYSKRSLEKLETCHSDLQTIFRKVLDVFDHSVISGYRGQEEQELAFREKRSQKHYPDSDHNVKPSMAIDVAPYPIDWNDTKRFVYLAGHVKGIAFMLKEEGKITHELGWGGDWDSDTEVKDNNFNDLGHFYLIVPRRTS